MLENNQSLVAKRMNSAVQPEPEEMRTEKETGRRVSRFAWRLEREWLRLGLPAGDSPVVVAVSGGADSTSLLLAMHELCISQRLDLQLTAAHLNHRLRADESDADAAWLKELTDRFRIPLVVESIDTGAEAARTQDNLEQAARRLRYDFLARTAANVGANYVLTAHTMDDQAETVLLRLMRGSGIDGLGGIKPIRKLNSAQDVMLVRPLLINFRRTETVEFCVGRGIDPRVDSMNSDPLFSRVRVRQELLPVLESFNPRFVESLVRTAELIAIDAESLAAVAQLRLDEVIRAYEDTAALDANSLALMPTGLRRRVLRHWLRTHRKDLRRIEAVHIQALDDLLQPGRGGRIVQLPGKGVIKRTGNLLTFRHLD